MRSVHRRTRGTRRPHNRRRHTRRGAIVVLTTILMIVMMALLALSIDTGYMYTMQTELDRSVDSAALAGAACLADGVDEANQRVVEYLFNPADGQPAKENSHQCAPEGYFQEFNNW